MKYIDYKERKEQGTFNFPVAFYHVMPHNPKYHMQYHWHPHYELIQIISGTFHLTLDNAFLWPVELFTAVRRTMTAYTIVLYLISRCWLSLNLSAAKLCTIFTRNSLRPFLF